MTGAPLSIVHLLAPAPFGGLESVVHTLARGQLDAGDRVTVASVLDADESTHPFVDGLREAGIPNRVLRPGGRGYLRERREVAALLHELKADVLHTHGYRPDVVDAPVARRSGVRTVSTVHGFTSSGWRGRLYDHLQVRAYRRFDVVVAVSEPIRARLLEARVPAAVVHVVRNAWAPSGKPFERAAAREALGLPAEGRFVGWVGRMSEEKAPDVMIRALASAPDAELGLGMVGAGPMLDALRELAQREGVSDRVRWLGVVPGAGSLLRAFDAVALSSWTEGTPMVLLEAASAGIPVVSTAVGGVPDVVGPAEAALVEAGDAAALGEAISEAAGGGPAAATRATAARKRVREDFAVRPWVDRYRTLYRPPPPSRR